MLRLSNKKTFWVFALFLPALFFFFISFPIGANAADAPKHSSGDVIESTPPSKVDGRMSERTESSDPGRVQGAGASENPQAGSKQPTAAKDSFNTLEMGGIELFFAESDRKADFIMERFDALFSKGLATTPQELSKAFDNLTEGKGLPALFWMILALVAIVAAGLIIEQLVRKKTASLVADASQVQGFGRWYWLRTVILQALVDFFCLCVYIFATFVFFFPFYPQGDPAYVFISSYLIFTYRLKIVMVLVGIVLRPKAPALRLLPLEDRDARFLYRWIIAFMGTGYFLGKTWDILRQMGINYEFFLFLYSSSGLIITGMLIAMIWQSRERVAHAIRAKYFDGMSETMALKRKIGEFWHVLAIFYVLFITGFWQAYLILKNQALGGKVWLSLLGIPALIIIDHWIQRLLDYVGSTATHEHTAEDYAVDGEASAVADQELPGTSAPKVVSTVGRYTRLIRRMARLFIVAAFLFSVLRMWGIDLAIGRYFTRAMLSVLVTVLLAYVIWEFASNLIDRKLRESMPDTGEEMEEGGAGGSRAGTLLILLKKFVLAVLIVMVTMIVLAAIGVNIGPLIAGAGVVGLAIGFGAQTLVKDIISGIFFLVDDAFRVGDYVDTGQLRGRVEHISLRSLRLRHHRGMVHTIPFGELSSITNFSRDYIVEKLEFRVRYGTDVDKVRKIIKKINKAIKADKEMSANLLSDIKSQGLRQLDDSAMIMRLKFKAVPGGQFVIKREVLRQLHEAFREQGIEFAHRNVTVYLPDQQKLSSTEEKEQAAEKRAASEMEKQLLEAGAAAAAIAEEEEAKKRKEGA